MKTTYGTTSSLGMTDDGTTVATLVEHTGRYWLARNTEGTRYLGDIDEDTRADGGASARFGSRAYVCSVGVRSWSTLEDAVADLRRELGGDVVVLLDRAGSEYLERVADSKIGGGL